jgi:putative membrane protein
MSGHGGGTWETLVPVAAVTLLALAYLLLARRAHHRRNPAASVSSASRVRYRSANRWRAAAFLGGCALPAIAVLPPVARFAHEDFRGHMLQHLLIGMYAPVALVLGAPVTVLLRALPAHRARRVTALLRSRPMRLPAHPITVLGLSTGGLVLLYFTPLYDATAGRPVLHWSLHVHFLVSGCLFAWLIAGPDPGPARPAVPARLVILGVAVAAHAVIAQLMYGGFLIHVHAPITQVRGGAEIMYYGGDIAELLLAAALVATWRPVSSPRRAAVWRRAAEASPLRRSR